MLGFRRCQGTQKTTEKTLINAYGSLPSCFLNTKKSHFSTRKGPFRSLKMRYFWPPTCPQTREIPSLKQIFGQGDHKWLPGEPQTRKKTSFKTNRAGIQKCVVGFLLKTRRLRKNKHPLFSRRQGRFVREKREGRILDLGYLFGVSWPFGLVVYRGTVV